MIEKIKMLGLAAAIAFAAPVAGMAATIIDVSDGVAVNGTSGISVGDILTMEIEGNAADGAGSYFFGFTATQDLSAIETNSLNTVNGFEGAMVEWNSESDGSGTSFGIISGADLIAGNSLITSFLSGETKYLIASWTNVSENRSNFDLRVTTAPVPVPAAGLMLITGLGGLAVARRRRKAS